jgi:sigma-B regulation protein RsbU (phosphoserine phosphatase)
MNEWAIYLPKFFLLAVAFSYLLSFSRKLRISFAPFYALFLLYTVRDILYVIFPFDFICVAADAGVVLCYLFWLRTFTGRKKIDLIAYILVAIAALGAAEQTVFGSLPAFVFFRSVWIYPIVFYFIAQIFQVTAFNTANSGEILQLRRTITYLFIFMNLPVLFLGYGDATHITQAFLYPLIYLAHGIIVYRITLNEVGKKDLSITSLMGSRENVFDFMQKLSAAVSEKIEIDKILSIVVASAIKNTGADGGAILMLDEFQKALKYRAIVGTYAPPFSVPDMVKIKSSRLEDYLYSLNLEIGKTLLGESFQKAEPIYIQNTQRDGRLMEGQNDGQASVSSLIIVPLLVSQRILGVITVSKQAWGQFFSGEDFEHLKAFADYASLSIDMHLTYLEVLEKKQIERELGIAAEIQKKLVPRKLPQFANTDLAVHSLPARGVSGDYFDVFRLDPKKLIILVGDVAGKGIPAALVMVMIHSIFHLIASPKRDIAAMLTWINRGLIGQVDIDRYATMSIMSYDETTRSIQYANAAHHPLLIYRTGSKTMEQVDTEGLPIGIDRGSAYRMKSISLSAGDIAVLYTDGITEAMNPEGEQYSLERLTQVLQGNYEMKAEELKKAIQKDLNDFTGSAKQHDDQTLVIMKTS